MDAPLLIPGITGAGQRLSAQFALGGPSAPGRAFTEVSETGDSSATNILQFANNPNVDATFTLFGLLHAAINVANLHPTDSDSGKLTGTAHYYVDVLTPGATLTSACGHNFGAPVPIPAPACLLASALGALGFIRRRA